jgi:hypothetical protein
MIVDSQSRGFITSGQHRSILRRLASVRMDSDRAKAIEYVRSLIEDAEYKDQLSQAKKFLKDLKSRMNNLGTAAPDAEAILKGDIKNLTMEELIRFNKIAAEVDVKFINPRVHQLANLSAIMDAAEEVEAVEATEITSKDILEKITEYKEKYTADKLVDRRTIVSAQRALTRLRSMYYNYLRQEKAEPTSTKQEVSSEISSIMQEIGKLEGSSIVGGELQQMIEDEKQNYIKQIIQNMKDK